MRLLTVGDSFTYGDELGDLGLSWPNLLAKQLGYDLLNLAKPGSGNTRMIRNSVENDADITIVAWSHFARMEMADDEGIFDIWPGYHFDYRKDPNAHRQVAVNYVALHHNDEYLYRQHLINIILMQSYFKSQNKRYIMLDSFGNNKQYMTSRDTVKDLYKRIDSTCYLGWPYSTMMEWTYGAEQGPRGHFLEVGHKIVADKVYEHIRNLGWIS